MMRQGWTKIAITCLVTALVPISAWAEPERAMARVHRDIATAAEPLWQRMGGFFALADWHPAIRASTMAADGRQRRITLNDGAEFVETLMTYDLRRYRYRYRVEDPNPLPFTDYVGTVRVIPLGSTSRVVWSATYRPTGDAGKVQETLRGLFAAGLDELVTEHRPSSNKSP